MNSSQINKSPIFNLKNKKKDPVLKLWHKLLFLSPIFIIVIIYKGNEYYKEYRLNTYGKETFAMITKISNAGVRDNFDIENIAFEFKADGNTITGYTQAETNNNYAFASNGLPLSVGDFYKVKYDSLNPELYFTNLSEPDPKTLVYYFNQAAKVIKKKNIFNDTYDPDLSIACFVQNIFIKYNYDGIATILFYDEYIAENFSHNAIKFKNFFDSEEVKLLIEKCSEK